MIRTALSAALLAVLATGCTVSVNTKPSATPSSSHRTASPSSVPTPDRLPFASRDRAFLAAVHARPAVFADSDEDLLGLGNMVCRSFDAGLGWLRIIRVLTSGASGYDPNDAGYIVGASVTALCPDHAGDLPVT